MIKKSRLFDQEMILNDDSERSPPPPESFSKVGAIMQHFSGMNKNAKFNKKCTSSTAQCPNFVLLIRAWFKINVFN